MLEGTIRPFIPFAHVDGLARAQIAARLGMGGVVRYQAEA